MTRARAINYHPTPQQLQALFKNPQHLVEWAVTLPEHTLLTFSPIAYYIEDRLGWGSVLGGRYNGDPITVSECADLPCVGYDTATGCMVVYPNRDIRSQKDIWDHPVQLPSWLMYFMRQLIEDACKQHMSNLRYTRPMILAALEEQRKKGWPQ